MTDGASGIARKIGTQGEMGGIDGGVFEGLRAEGMDPVMIDGWDD